MQTRVFTVAFIAVIYAGTLLAQIGTGGVSQYPSGSGGGGGGSNLNIENNAGSVIVTNPTALQMLTGNGGFIGWAISGGPTGGPAGLQANVLPGGIAANIIIETSSVGAGVGAGMSYASTGLTAGSAYYLTGTGGALALAEANSASTASAVCVAISATDCVTTGTYQFSSTQSWTAGPVYLSAASAGALTQTPPTGSNYIVVIGQAAAAGTIQIGISQPLLPQSTPCPTCVTSAAALTANSVVTGAGLQASQTVPVTISSGGQLSWLTGLGAIVQLQGPTDQPLAIRSASPAQTTTTAAGNALNIVAANAVAGSSVASGAAGGALALQAGAGAFLTSGTANGGNASLTGGSATDFSTGGTASLVGGNGSNGNGGNVAVTAGVGGISGNVQVLVPTVNAQGTSQTAGLVSITAGTWNGSSVTTADVGGALTFAAGAGEASNAAPCCSTGKGGNASFTGGAGGAATSSSGVHTGSAGGTAAVTGGAGGAATAGGTPTGGVGGGLVLGSGAGGTGTTPGANGTVTFKAGATNAGFITALAHFLFGTVTTEGNYLADVTGSGSAGTFRVKDQTATTGATRMLIDLGAADTASTTTFANNGSGKMVHFSGNGSTPTVAAGGAIGTVPTITGTDFASTVSVPSTAVTTGTLFTVTFGTGYASAPVCMVAQNGGIVSVGIGHSTPGTTSLAVTAAIANVSAAAYLFDIICSGN